MKYILIFLSLFLSSCKVCEPVSKPVGQALMLSGAKVVEVATVPAIALQDNESIPPIIKIPFFVPAFGVAVGGTCIGFPIFVGGLLIYPDAFN